MNQFALAISVAASLGAAAIHFALGPHHIEELGALGFGFYLAGVLQAGGAVALVVGRHTVDARRPFVLAGIAVNAAIVCAWMASRFAGLPAGPQPWTPEAIGVADSVSTALELLIVAMGVVALREAPASAERPREGVRARSIVLGPPIALIAVATSFALFSPDGVAGHRADGHAHDRVDSHAPAELQFVESQPPARLEPTFPNRTTPDVDRPAEIVPLATAAPDVVSGSRAGHDHAAGNAPEPHAH